MSLRLGSRSCLARSAPRAHVRELLCETQSSKERLRRSRTESSGAAPAIEELAGGARQVRPAGPRADQYQPGSDFSRAKRSGGRPALRLPRATFSHRRSPCRLHTDYALQKSEIPATVLTSPIRRGPEGDRPSGSHEHQNRAEVPHSASLSTAHGSRKTKTAPFRNTGRGGRKNGKDYFSSRSAREEPETRSAGFFTAPE